jgi:hypothetical protein
VTGPSGLPWSSLLINLIFLLVLLLLKTALESPSKINREAAILLGGALCGMAFFIRIQMIISFFILLILLIVARPLYLRIPLYFAAGGLASLLSSIVFLAQNNALRPFFEQGIIWAANFYGSPRIDRSYVLNILWFPAIFLVVMFLKRFLRFPGFKLLGRGHIFFRVFLIAIFFLVVSYLSSIPRDSVRTLFSIKGFILGSAWNMNHWLGFFSVSLVILLFAILCTRAKKLGLSRLSELLSANVAFLFGITSITQLYPLYDLWHVWFITPVLLASTVMSDMTKRVGNILSKDFQAICFVFVVITILTSTKISAPGAYQFTTPVLAGMTSSAPGARSMDMTMLALAEKGDVGHIRFICPLGLYAAANGKYMSNDLNYVNWGNFADSSSRKISQVFICETSRSEISSYERRGWEIKFLFEMGVKNYDDTTIVYNALLGRASP